MGRVHWLAVCLCCYLSAVVAVNNQCYNGYCFIKPDPLPSGDVQKTFTDAQQWCRNNSAVLLEIPDEHVQEAVQSYLSKNPFNSSPFLNAQFQEKVWTWSDGTTYDNSWGGAIQTGRNADAKYAYMTFDQAHNRFSIFEVTVWDATTRTAVCQYSGDQCPPGVSLTDGLCIMVNTSSSSWFGARLSCYWQGGDLASLHDLHMNSSPLANKLRSQTGYSPTGYWIGLTNEQWSWQDSETQMVYNNWQPGSPGSLPCLCLNNNGLWTDCDCGSRPFICLQNVKTTSTSASPPVMSISTSSYSQPTSTSKSSSQVTSFPKSSNETPSTSKFSNQTSTSESSSQATPTTTFSDQRSNSKSNNQTISSMASSNQTSSVGVAVGVSVGIFVLILIILAILLVVFRKRCKIGSLFRKPSESVKSKEVPIYQDAAFCLPTADVLPPGTAFSNVTYSSPNDEAPKVGPYEAIHPSDNIYSEPDQDNGNKYSEVSFNPTDVEAGSQPAVEYMELCNDAGVGETSPHEGVTSGKAAVRDNPYDNFVKEPVNSSSPSIELSSPLRNSGSNDDTILLDNELYS